METLGSFARQTASESWRDLLGVRGSRRARRVRRAPSEPCDAVGGLDGGESAAGYRARRERGRCAHAAKFREDHGLDDGGSPRALRRGTEGGEAGGRGDGAAAPRAWATDIRLRAERLATRPSRPAPCQTPFPDAATIFYVWTIVATLLGRVLI